MVLMGLMLIGMALETLGVGLVIPTIALLMQDDIGRSYPALRPILNALGNPGQQALIVWGMIGLITVYAIKASFLGFLAWRQTRFAFGVQAHLAQRLFTTYLRQPYTFHLQRNSAQLMRNIVAEVTQFTGGAIMPAMIVMTEALVMIGIGSLLVAVEPVGALIVVIVLGGMSWAFHRSTRARIERWGKARQHHEGLRLQHLQQGLGGAKDVKLLGREADFLAQFGTHNSQSARASMLHSTLQQISRLWLELLAVAGLATLVLTMVARGRDMATVVPTLGLFGMAAFRLMPSINRVLASVQSARYALPVVNILHEELSLPTSVPPARHTEPVRGFQREIRLNDVSYTYDGAPRPALNHLSFVIRRGESVGFIGPSGAGKSTLVDVILGLLASDTGQVCVDGRDISGDIRSWQDQIGYVPQAIYLTDDTLRRNVAFGLPDAQIDSAAVTDAIRVAQLEDFVKTLPDGLETVVGERGVRLSGGQRQRIGIARALYHNPEVLVLDEATSALDAVTERGVMQSVEALHGSKTVIIVAHRATTVEYCDRLCRLEHGRVVEEGAPEVVLGKSPEFAARAQA